MTLSGDPGMVEYSRRLPLVERGWNYDNFKNRSPKFYRKIRV